MAYRAIPRSYTRDTAEAEAMSTGQDRIWETETGGRHAPCARQAGRRSDGSSGNPRKKQTWLAPTYPAQLRSAVGSVTLCYVMPRTHAHDQVRYGLPQSQEMELYVDDVSLPMPLPKADQ
jgi:hypothetical protein